MTILFPSEFIYKLKKDLKQSALVAIIGNGGSQASAIHVASDLIKKGYPILDLNNPCFITANSNDHGFENSYMQFFLNCRFKDYVRIFNDKEHKGKFILIILTVHGGKVLENNKLWSENLYNAAKEAKKQGWKVVTISGESGKITEISDYYLIVYDDIEASQVKIMHKVIENLGD